MFDKLVQEKIHPIFGDLTEPNLGLSDAVVDMIKKQVNIIFNCAGNLDGNESLESSVKVRWNVYMKIFEAYLLFLLD